MNSHMMRIILFLAFFMQGYDLRSQEQNTYASRDAFYDSLEARARALSARLAEISGTEPIPFERPAPSILSTIKPTAPNQAQAAFDSLPAPKGSAVPGVPAAPKQQATNQETLYRADGTPVVLVKEVNEPASEPRGETHPRLLMEKDRGRYFVQPFVGVAMMSSRVTYSDVPIHTLPATVGSIETEVGTAVGISYGRRWENLDAEVHFSYTHVGYDSIAFTQPATGTYETEGDMELFQAGARIGYGIPFGESGWFRAAGGFGYGKRKDYVSLAAIPFIEDKYENNSVFSYDLLVSMGYEMAMGLDGFVAYRLLGASGNGNYSSVAMHLFEVGLGANF